VTDDDLEVVRIEQHLALLSDGEFASLIARTRAPVITDAKDMQTVNNLGDPELRKLLHRLLGQDEPEPVNSAVVAREGRSTGTPRITDEQYARDFVARVTGRIPAHGAELPEKES
jgi:hypothetical protein